MRAGWFGRWIGLGLLVVAPRVGASDLLDLYREALASDPRLLRAESELALYQARERYELGGLLPQASLGAQGTRTRRDSSDPAPGAPESNYYYGERYYATLTQPLYDKSSWEAWRSAGHETNQYEARYQSVASEVAVDLLERYSDVLAAEDNLEFILAEREAAGGQLEQVRARYERKLARITDLFALEARTDMLRSQELDARNAVEIARERLAEVMGRTVDEPLASLRGTVPEFWGSRPLEDWLAMGMDTSAQLIARREALEMAAGRVKEAAGRHHPTLNLQLSAQKSDIGFENADIPTFEVYVAALNLTIPIYSGGQVSAQVREAKARLRIAEQNYEETERTVRRGIRESFLNVEAARDRIEATSQAVRSAEKSYEAVQKGYEYGTVTIVDVLNASQMRYEAARDARQAYYDLMLHGLSLRQLSGQFNPEHVATLNQWLVSVNDN